MLRWPENTDQILPCRASHISGEELFVAAMKHFGNSVKGIKGDWFYGSNLRAINRLTGPVGPNKPSGRVDARKGVGGLTLEEAITKTWTAERAREWGFTEARLLEPPMGSDGDYLKLKVIYTRKGE